MNKSIDETHEEVEERPDELFQQSSSNPQSKIVARCRKTIGVGTSSEGRRYMSYCLIQ